MISRKRLRLLIAQLSGVRISYVSEEMVDLVILYLTEERAQPSLFCCVYRALLLAIYLAIISLIRLVRRLCPFEGLQHRSS